MLPVLLDIARPPHMSVKSDRWIRYMAEVHRLIEPFEPHQVRQNTVGSVISFGTSSYGNETWEVSYKDRAGKYQGQTGVTLPRA
jgi:deoxycytidine triphosphate deaminase